MNILTATKEEIKNYFKEHAPDKCFDCSHCVYGVGSSIICMVDANSYEDMPKIITDKKITSCNKKEKR